jgi:hypothetical protein
MAAVDILVAKADLTKAEASAAAIAPLADGEARLRVELLALTANTVTYAVAGDAFGYWKFFPAPEGFGKTPAWGFGVVEDSRADGVALGERVYGYFPVASHLTIQPGRIDAAGFMDNAAHRQGLSPVYNRYQRTAADPDYKPQDEALIAAFRPLFTTAFLLNAMYARAAMFGAEQAVISSASSKTGYALGYLMKQAGLKTVGLTSAGNRAFVEGLGVFDRVCAYDEIGGLPADTPSAYIDMAGSASVTHAVHSHFGDALKNSAVVGMTHWTAPRGQAAPPGLQPTLFFAPDHAVALTKEWGPDVFQSRLAEGLAGFLGFIAPKLRVRHVEGPEAVAQAFAQTAAGSVDPAEILTVRV